MSPLQSGSVGSGRLAFPTHAGGTVDDEDYIASFGRVVAGEPTAGNPWSGESDRENGNQPHPQEHQPHFFETDPALGIAAEFQELHGSPADDVVFLLAQQMCEHGQGDACQTEQHH